MNNNVDLVLWWKIKRDTSRTVLSEYFESFELSNAAESGAIR